MRLQARCHGMSTSPITHYSKTDASGLGRRSEETDRCRGAIRAADPGDLAAAKGPGVPDRSRRVPTPPDLEEFLRRSQDKLRTVLPGGNLGGKGLSLVVLAAIAIWGFSGFFRVDPDELGVVLRFGKYVRARQTGPQLSLALPDRDSAHSQGHPRQPHRHRDAAGRGLAPRHYRSRCTGREPDAHRRREYRRRRFLGILGDQTRTAPANICSTSSNRKAL